MISSEWFRHLPKEEQKDFEEYVRSSVQILSRLQTLLKEKEGSLTVAESKPETYDAGYPYRQAFFNGRRAGLQDTLRLLEFLDQEKRKETK